MDKYFDTLDQAESFHVEPGMTEKQRMKIYKRALNVHHNAGPEAKHIVKIWREQKDEQTKQMVCPHCEQAKGEKA